MSIHNCLLLVVLLSCSPSSSELREHQKVQNSYARTTGITDEGL